MPFLGVMVEPLFHFFELEGADEEEDDYDEDDWDDDELEDDTE